MFGESTYSPDDDAIHELAESMRERNVPEGDHAGIPIGFTFLGQFVDHDLTLDATSLLGQLEDPTAVTDFRTPNLDLDSLYGAGPGVDRFFYDTRGPDGKSPVKLLIDEGRDFDLPRNTQNTAIIGDLRNDENFLISQLHLAFIKFHNRVVDHLRPSYPNNGELFGKASELVRWHYQWILVHEFLPAILGPAVVDDVLTNGRKLFHWKSVGADFPFMPVEFSTAAYRLGHTMLRQDYQVTASKRADLFDLPVFGAPRLQGPQEKLDFKLFFDFPGSPRAQRARRFDAKIPEAVFQLPFIDDKHDHPVSLPERNMLRAKVFKIPSGQEVAGELQRLNVPGIRTFTNKELGIDGIKGLKDAAPLWFYILKESELAPSATQHLGPMGGRIVAEVILGMLTDIKGNYLHDCPDWTPKLPSATKGDFRITDLLTFANA